MAKYMITARYTKEGASGLLADGGTGRRTAVEALLKSVGGKLETFYYMFGKDDLVAIMDVPDAETATALALTIGASGAVNVRTSVLLTPEQIDAAVKISPAYRPPGS